MKKINIDELIVREAHIEGGSFLTDNGYVYYGKWYQAYAEDNEGEEYMVIWTDVDWDAEDSGDACDWDNPDYILNNS